MKRLIATREGDNLYQTGVSTIDTPTGPLTTATGVVELEDGTTITVDDVVTVLGRGYWEIVADTITDDAMQKERPRQFGSRSEAGRYAAQVRWGTRSGGAPTATHAASPEGEPTFDLSTAILEGRPYAPLMREHFPPDIQKDLDTVEMWWQQKNIGADPENGPTDEEMAVLREASARVRPRLQEYFEQHLDMSGLTPEARAAVEKAGVTNKWYRELLNNEEITVQEHYGTTRVRARTLTAQYMASEYSHVMYKEGLSTGLDGKTQREGTSRVAAEMDAITHMDTNAVTVTVPSKVVGAILTNGGLKNQFSSRSSGGLKDYDARALSEMTAFGTHPLTIPSKRPVYGTLHPYGVRHPKQNGCEQYGDVQIVLKPSTQARTTFSPHDSLLMGRLHNPLSGPTKPITYNDWETDGKTQLGHARDGTRTPWYIETQIHGGVTLSDIAFIAAPKGVLGENVLKRLAKAGIEVKDLPDESAGFPVVKSMRRLIATSGDRTLYQTGFTTLWAGTVLENQIAAGVVVENGTEIEVPSIGSVLARGYWDIIADTVEPVDKGRPRQFASRSEAGRYAAQIRWGNRTQGATASGSHATAIELQPTDDPSEAVLTGRPYSALLLENLPPRVRMELEAIETLAEKTGGMSVPPLSSNATKQLTDHLLAVTDPSLLSDEARATLQGLPRVYRSYGDPKSDEFGRQEWAQNTVSMYTAAAAERGLAKHQPDSLQSTKDVVANPEKMRLAISVDSYTLAGIDKTGEVTTQFAGVLSKGYHDPHMRQRHEAVAYGTHPATVPTMRPIYGAISPLGIRSTHADGVEQYGNVRLVLKRSVAERSTFSVHDSLGLNRNPSKVTGPITRGQASPYKGTHSDPATRLTKIRNGQRHDYPEVQVHGGVKISDVSHIAVDVPHGKKTVEPLIKEFAEKHNLKIILVERPPMGNQGKGYKVIDDSKLQKSLDAFAVQLREIVAKAAKRQFGSRSEAGRYAAQVRWGAAFASAVKSADDLEKARQRQFSSRSEAGRYAAQIRWGNRGAQAGGQQDTRTQDQIEMDELRTMATEAQAVMQALNDNPPNGVVIDATPEFWETTGGTSNMLMVHLRGTNRGEMVPSKRIAEAEQMKQRVGEKALDIAERRLAERGYDKVKMKADDEALKLATKQVENDLSFKYNMLRWQERRGLDTSLTRQQITDLQTQVNDLYAARKKSASYDSMLKEEVRGIIADVRPLGGALNLRPLAGMSEKNPSMRELEHTVAGIVPKAVMDKAPRLLFIRYGAGKGNAGSYNHGSQTINMKRGLSNEEFQSTGLHEYAHAMQYTIPAVKVMDTVFLMRRIRGGTAGEGTQNSHEAQFWGQRPRLIQDQAGTQLVRRYTDSFERDYTGVTYRGRILGDNPHAPADVFQPNEVLTTGIQSLLGRGLKGQIGDRDLLAHVAGVLITA